MTATPRCRSSPSWVSAGWSTGDPAVELMLAGASAVQVGTASFADPRSVAVVRDGVGTWCARAGVSRVRDLIGGAHG